MLTRAVALLTLVCLAFPPGMYAAEPAAYVGDIVLVGTVERDGRPLANDATLFEGDRIRTRSESGGMIRLGRARIEIAESTSIQITQADPLQVRVDFGSVLFNMPEGEEFEFLTPQLEIRSDPAAGPSSGQILAVPGEQDRIQGINGLLYALERQEFGSRRGVRAGEILVAALVPTAVIPTAAALPVPQDTEQIAEFEAISGDVFLQRAGTQLSAMAELGSPLFDGDTVSTQDGQAEIRFTDDSLITLDIGTTVVIEEREQPEGGILRRLSQTAGSLWFNIQQFVGKQTDLETPTAIAAIRGTEGVQFVPNETQSTHALEEGIQEITENITQQTVELNAGEVVTAIRGVGFTPIAALLAVLPRPGVGGGGAGAGAGGGAAGGAGGAAGATAGAATTTVTSVASVAAAAGATAGAGAASALVANEARDEPTDQDPTPPVNFPGAQVRPGQARTLPAASPSRPVTPVGPPFTPPGPPVAVPPGPPDGVPGRGPNR